MELSAKDKKLLVYLLALAIVGASYYFGARIFLDKQATIGAEAEELQQKVNHCNEIYANREIYEKNIADAQIKYTETANKFYGGLDQENTIMMLKSVENSTNIWVERVAFQEEELMVAPATEVSAEGENTESVEPDLAAETGEAASISGMKQNLSIDYSASYGDFKTFVNYVVNSDKRLFISSLSASYTPDDSKISGALVLSQYAISGADIEYEAPNLNNITVGVGNIFTTLEGAGGVPSVEMQTLTDETEGPAGEESGESEGNENESEGEDAGESASEQPEQESAPENPPDGGGSRKPAGGVV